MSVEKIKMMNRGTNLRKRIVELSNEKSNLLKELDDMGYDCEHEIIIRDEEYGFAECIFCGNDGFLDVYLKENPAVITISRLKSEGSFLDTMKRIRKKYKQIWAEEDTECSEEQMREKLKESLEESLEES